jgi:predicted ribosomally synthesized peptide with nif11-like leader
MSIESAKAFIERMQTDEDFAKKVMACKDVDTAQSVIEAAGFAFTQEEFRSLIGDDLDDEALSSVSGGRWCGYSR